MSEKIGDWKVYNNYPKYDIHYYHRISDGLVLAYIDMSKYPYAAIWGTKEDTSQVIGKYIDIEYAQKAIEDFNNQQVIKENNYLSFLKEQNSKQIERDEIIKQFDVILDR
jgi:hypothetical protein